MSYGELFLTILPVFALIVLGAALRHWRVIVEAAEDSLFNVVIKVAMPCLIFESVAGNATLRAPGNLLLAPLVGFTLTLMSIGVAYAGARLVGLKVGTGLRTFALTVGIANYGYLPLPMMEAMFGPESRGILLVHNVGVEAALWTGGILVISGLSPRDGWRKLINAPMISLVVALGFNLLNLTPLVPGVVMNIVHAMGVCAIPLGLLMTGVSIQPHLGDPGRLFAPRISLAACAVRLGVLPVLFLVVARYGPFSLELKRVIVVQAAMPTAVISVIIARIYGGQPLTSVQIVLVTTALALFTLPFWIQFGLRWVTP